MARHWLLLPNRHLTLAIPIALVSGLILGLLFRFPTAQALMMPAIILMIFPIMIGMPWQEVARFRPVTLLALAAAINFVVIPLVALGLGRWLLADSPAMLGGLAVASLLPTSGMTISWTMLSGGNVPAATRITVISLLAGSLLMPLYLLGMVGALVEVNLLLTFARVGMMVILPMVLGTLAHRWLMKRYTPEQFKSQVKPLLPAISVWAMLYVIFLSTASRAQNLVASPGVLVRGAAVLVLFYLINFAISTLAGRLFLNKADGYTLVYSTVLRNLSIALGLSMATFGAHGAFIVTLAFVFQVQAAAWYGRAAQAFGFFGREAAAA